MLEIALRAMNALIVIIKWNNYIILIDIRANFVCFTQIKFKIANIRNIAHLHIQETKLLLTTQNLMHETNFSIYLNTKLFGAPTLMSKIYLFIYFFFFFFFYVFLNQIKKKNYYNKIIKIFNFFVDRTSNKNKK